MPFLIDGEVRVATRIVIAVEFGYFAAHRLLSMGSLCPAMTLSENPKCTFGINPNAHAMPSLRADFPPSDKKRRLEGAAF
jgi:hypothetical protein